MAKLIDLMRQAGVQWPDGAEYAAQDGDDGLLVFYCKEPHLCYRGSKVWHSDHMTYTYGWIDAGVAEDWRETLTREQWEKAK